MEKIKEKLIKKQEFILSVIDIMSEKPLIAYLIGQLNLIKDLLKDIEKLEEQKNENK